MGDATDAADRPTKRTLVELHVDPDDDAWDLLREAVRARRGEPAPADPVEADADEPDEESGRSWRRLLVGFVALDVLAAVGYLVYRIRFAGGGDVPADDADADANADAAFDAAAESTFETELDDGSEESSGIAPLSDPRRSGTASLVGLAFLVGVTVLRRRLADGVGPGDADEDADRERSGVPA